MSDFLDDVPYQKPTKRPMFLQVLCILTFVSCGLVFMSDINSLVSNGLQEKMMQKTSKQMQRQQQQMRQQFQEDTPEIFDQMISATERAQAWSTTSNYLSIANCMICCVGALLMWRMRKAGYFIYIFGQLLPFIALYGIYSIFQDVPVAGVLMLIYSIFTVICAMAFIVMYGLNFKHLR